MEARPTGTRFSEEERESHLVELAKFGASIVTDVVPHYVGLVTGLIELMEADDQAQVANALGGLVRVCLSFGVPLIRITRLLSERGDKLAGVDQGDDPRILIPLVRTLGESYVSLAAITDIADVPQAFPAPREAISRLVDDPRLNEWLLAQHRLGRLPAASTEER